MFLHRAACKKEETTRTHVESLMCKVQSSLKGKNQMWSEREEGVCQKRKKTVSPLFSPFSRLLPVLSFCLSCLLLACSSLLPILCLTGKWDYDASSGIMGWNHLCSGIPIFMNQLGSVVGLGRMSFEDDLKSGHLLYCTINISRYKTIEATGNTSVIPTTSESFSLYWEFLLPL